LIVLSIGCKCRNKSINHHYFLHNWFKFVLWKSKFQRSFTWTYSQVYTRAFSSSLWLWYAWWVDKIKCFDNPSVKSSLTFCVKQIGLERSNYMLILVEISELDFYLVFNKFLNAWDGKLFFRFYSIASIQQNQKLTLKVEFSRRSPSV
jgi:hypothetical protein